MYSKRFALILLVFLGALVFWLNESVRVGLGIVQADSKVPSLTAYQVNTTLFDKMGLPLNRLATDTFRYYRATDAAWATSAVFEHINANQSWVVVKSERAQLLRKTNVLSMQGKVKLVRSQDQSLLTITSSDVFVRLQDEFVYSSSPTMLVMNQNQVEARGFDLDNRTGIVNLYKDVKVSYVKAS